VLFNGASLLTDHSADTAAADIPIAPAPRHDLLLGAPTAPSPETSQAQGAGLGHRSSAGQCQPTHLSTVFEHHSLTCAECLVANCS
jgi:hypothetical protein